MRWKTEFFDSCDVCAGKWLFVFCDLREQRVARTAEQSERQTTASVWVYRTEENRWVSDGFVVLGFSVG